MLNQPTSSPMMKMMLGFCWADTGATSAASGPISASSTNQTLRIDLMSALLPGLEQIGDRFTARRVRRAASRSQAFSPALEHRRALLHERPHTLLGIPRLPQP